MPTFPAITQCLPMVRAARDADQRRDRRVRADAHVVSHLDQVIEPDALFDHRVRQRAAIDRGVGADLHVVTDLHRSQLRIFTHAPLSGAFPNPSDPTTTPGCRMHRSPIDTSAHTVTRATSRVSAAIRAFRITTQCGPSTTFAPSARAVLDHTTGSHGNPGLEPRTPCNDRRRMRPGFAAGTGCSTEAMRA